MSAAGGVPQAAQPAEGEQQETSSDALLKPEILRVPECLVRFEMALDNKLRCLSLLANTDSALGCGPPWRYDREKREIMHSMLVSMNRQLEEYLGDICAFFVNQCVPEHAERRRIRESRTSGFSGLDVPATGTREKQPKEKSGKKKPERKNLELVIEEMKKAMSINDKENAKGKDEISEQWYCWDPAVKKNGYTGRPSLYIRYPKQKDDSPAELAIKGSTPFTGTVVLLRTGKFEEFMNRVSQLCYGIRCLFAHGGDGNMNWDNSLKILFEAASESLLETKESRESLQELMTRHRVLLDFQDVAPPLENNDILDCESDHHFNSTTSTLKTTLQEMILDMSAALRGMLSKSNACAFSHAIKLIEHFVNEQEAQEAQKSLWGNLLKSASDSLQGCDDNKDKNTETQKPILDEVKKALSSSFQERGEIRKAANSHLKTLRGQDEESQLAGFQKDLVDSLQRMVASLDAEEVTCRPNSTFEQLHKSLRKESQNWREIWSLEERGLHKLGKECHQSMFEVLARLRETEIQLGYRRMSDDHNSSVTFKANVMRDISLLQNSDPCFKNVMALASTLRRAAYVTEEHMREARCVVSLAEALAKLKRVEEMMAVKPQKKSEILWGFSTSAVSLCQTLNIVMTLNQNNAAGGAQARFGLSEIHCRVSDFVNECVQQYEKLLQLKRGKPTGDLWDSGSGYSEEHLSNIPFQDKGKAQMVAWILLSLKIATKKIPELSAVGWLKTGGIRRKGDNNWRELIKRVAKDENIFLQVYHALRRPGSCTSENIIDKFKEDNEHTSDQKDDNKEFDNDLKQFSKMKLLPKFEKQLVLESLNVTQMIEGSPVLLFQLQSDFHCQSTVNAIPCLLDLCNQRKECDARKSIKKALKDKWDTKVDDVPHELRNCLEEVQGDGSRWLETFTEMVLFLADITIEIVKEKRSGEKGENSKKPIAWHLNSRFEYWGHSRFIHELVRVAQKLHHYCDSPTVSRPLEKFFESFLHRVSPYDIASIIGNHVTVDTRDNEKLYNALQQMLRELSNADRKEEHTRDKTTTIRVLVGIMENTTINPFCLEKMWNAWKSRNFEKMKIHAESLYNNFGKVTNCFSGSECRTHCTQEVLKRYMPSNFPSIKGRFEAFEVQSCDTFVECIYWHCLTCKKYCDDNMETDEGEKCKQFYKESIVHMTLECILREYDDERGKKIAAMMYGALVLAQLGRHIRYGYSVGFEFGIPSRRDREVLPIPTEWFRPFTDEAICSYHVPPNKKNGNEYTDKNAPVWNNYGELAAPLYALNKLAWRACVMTRNSSTLSFQDACNISGMLRLTGRTLHQSLFAQLTNKSFQEACKTSASQYVSLHCASLVYIHSYDERHKFPPWICPYGSKCSYLGSGCRRRHLSGNEDVESANCLGCDEPSSLH